MTALNIINITILNNACIFKIFIYILYEHVTTSSKSLLMNDIIKYYNYVMQVKQI